MKLKVLLFASAMAGIALAPMASAAGAPQGVWLIDGEAAVQIFESDRERFVSGTPGFLTQDEENSGVIEVTDIVRTANWYEAGRRYYLGNMQAHYEIPGELVQGGQVYLMASPNAVMPAAKPAKGK